MVKSGSGKTTLLNIIGLLEDYDLGDLLVNNILVNDLTTSSKRLFRKNIGYVFQGINLLSNLNVIDNVSLPLKLSGISKNERYLEAVSVLKQINLEHLIDRYPHQLSQGQLQRVSIARALISKPKLLLCDEITSNLDFESSLEIINVLKKINNELSITVVFVSHDLDIVKLLCNKVSILDSGNLVNTLDLNINNNYDLSEKNRLWEIFKWYTMSLIQI